jgi:Putative phage tail protein
MSSGCNSSGDDCRTAGTGPSCVDTSHPANANANVNITFDADGKITVSGDKETCIKEKLGNCSRLLSSCMRQCMATTEEKIYRQDVKDADERLLVAQGTLESLATAPPLRSCVSHLGAYANWKCWAACESEIHCDTTSCYCSELTCGSAGGFSTTPASVKRKRDRIKKDKKPADEQKKSTLKERVAAEMRLTNSGYGVPVEQIYGRHYVTGNIIWIGNAARITDASGVRADGTTSRAELSASYYDFALALAAGPIAGVGKIYVNDTLVSDTGVSGGLRDPSFFGTYAGNEASYVARGTEIILYDGSEQQPNNPYMADVAHRGIAYLFFRRFSVAHSTAQFPEIVVEVIENADTTPTVEHVALAPTAGETLFTFDNASRALTLNSVSADVLSYDVDDITAPPSVTPLASADMDTVSRTTQGNFLAQTSGVGVRPYRLYSGLDGSVTATSSASYPAAGMRSFLFTDAGARYLLSVGGGNTGTIDVVPYAENPASINTPSYTKPALGRRIQYGQVFAEMTSDGFSGYRRALGLISTDTSTNALAIHDILLSDSQNLPDRPLTTTLLPAYLWNFIGGGVDLRLAFFDGGSDRAWIFAFAFLSGTGVVQRFVRYSVRDAKATWITDVSALPPRAGNQPNINYPTHIYRYFDTSGVLWTLDKLTGAVVITQAPTVPASGFQIYDAASDKLYVRTLTGLSKVTGRSLTRTEISIATAVGKLARSVGITEDEIDTTDIAGISFVGSKIQAADAALETLGEWSSAYGFDIRSENGRIVFRRLTSAVVIPIAETETVSAHNRRERRLLDGDASKRVNLVEVQYSDVGHKQFKTNKQSFVAPERDADGNTITNTTWLVLTPTQAWRYAERLGRLATAEDSEMLIRTGPRYTRGSGGDRVALTREDGTFEDWVIRTARVGGDLSVEYTMYYAGSYTQTAPTSLAPATDAVVEAEQGKSSTPLVWTTRHIGSPHAAEALGGLPFFAGALPGPWSAVSAPSLSIRRDGGVVGHVTKPLHVGRLLTPLETPTDPATRQSASMIVRFSSSAVVQQLTAAADQTDFTDVVTSYTKNLLFVGAELMQYGNFSVAIDGVTVTFTDLYRGRGGTDVYIGDPTATTHTDRVIVYSHESVLSFYASHESSAGLPVTVYTTTVIDGVAYNREASVLGVERHNADVPPISARVSSVTPLGHRNPTGRHLFFDYKRRSRVDTSFGDGDFARLNYPQSALPYTAVFRRRLTPTLFREHFRGGVDDASYLGALTHPWRLVQATNPDTIQRAYIAIDETNIQNRGALETAGTLYYAHLGVLQLVISEVPVEGRGAYFTAFTWGPGVKNGLTLPHLTEQWYIDV